MSSAPRINTARPVHVLLIDGKGGMLFVKAGTRLTSSTAEKLATVLDQRSIVEVVDAA